MKVKNIKLVIGFMISAILFALCAVVTGTMDVTPDWLPQVCDFASIVASVLGIKVVVPTKETDKPGENKDFRKQDAKTAFPENGKATEGSESPS